MGYAELNYFRKVAVVAKDHIFFYLTAKKKKLCLKEKLEGTYLVATKGGLYLLTTKYLKKIRLGEYYGITVDEDGVFVLKKSEKKSQLFKLCFHEKKVKSQLVIDDLPAGCHQIDLIKNAIYIVDTYNNRILKYATDGKFQTEYFPSGKIEKGRLSDNYVHMNSIFSTSDEIYVVFHNETVKSGKTSKIFVMDLNFKKIREINIDANSAHNVAVMKGKIIVCDSYNRRLLVDNIPVLETEHFMRGLSLTDKKILLGGSSYASRNNRWEAAGAIYLLDHNYTIIDVVVVSHMVQEIRMIDGVDYSMSKYSGCAGCISG